MKFRFTILNVATFLFLISCIVYTIVNYSTLSYEEGWGVVYMVGIFLFGLTALIADFIIRRVIKNKTHQNITSAITLGVYVVIFFIGNGHY
jgi:xanthine/uracil/vitamin C permease (AzgA family)